MKICDRANITEGPRQIANKMCNTAWDRVKYQIDFLSLVFVLWINVTHVTTHYTRTVSR